MTKWNVFKIMIIVGATVGVPWYLITNAANGDVIASFVLGVLVAAVLAGAGFMAAYMQTKTHAESDNRRFLNNMRENLALMQQAQQVAARASAQPVQQTAPSNGGALVFDESLFLEPGDE